jgi:hypothetical protein
MGRFELGHPSFGTVAGSISIVLSFAALIVALSGSADARSSHLIVRKGDIARGAVTARSLARGAVHTNALAAGAVKAKALAADAVGSSALAKGSVTPDALAHDSVDAGALADGSVTAVAIAPGSVYGAALGAETVHIVPIADLDAVAENGTWTASNTEVASCSPGEHLLDGGFAFTNPGNREVAFLQALPFSTGSTSGVSGRITSNSGGSAAAEVVALCLK